MKARLAFVLALTTAVSACRDHDLTPTEPDLAQDDIQSSTGVVMQDSLFTVVELPVLTGVQEAMLGRIRDRESTAEVSVARLASNAGQVLQRGRTVHLSVSPTEHLVVLGEQVVQRAATDMSWAGPIRNGDGWVQLVLTSNGITGTVRTGGRLYRIEPIGSGLHAIVRINLANLPPEHSPDNPSGASAPAPGAYPRSGLASGSVVNSLSSASSTATNIDVMVVYTAAAASAAGDIGGLIQLAIDETNTSYSNSGIGAQLSKVHVAQVSYSEASRSYAQHVAALEGTSDGSMDVIHSWRNQYGADVVLVVVSDAEACGRASQIMASSTTAFAAVHYDCATGYYSFGHEIGHLQGARHDRAVDSSNNPFQYGHGYVDPNDQWRTIMGYANACGSCPRVQYWSNPDITYPATGQVMGTSTYEDNARVLDGTASTIAGFRASANALNAQIDGPVYVNHAGPHTWTVTANGGTGSYTYDWRIYWWDHAGGNPNDPNYWTGTLSTTSSMTIDDILASDGEFEVWVTVQSGGGQVTEGVFVCNFIYPNEVSCT